MEITTHRRRQKSTSAPPSPNLLRSRSGSPATSLHESRTCRRSCQSQRYTTTSTPDYISRSKSNSKSRNRRNGENGNLNSFNTVNSVTSKKKSRECEKNGNSDKDGFVRFLPRDTDFGAVARKAKSVTSSPSAWALSPGRSPQIAVPTKTAPATVAVKVKSNRGSGGVSGVLRYFRQKKVSPVQEEEYHNFRILYNRLLQYRFANARAEAAMASMKNSAEGKLLGGWVRVWKMRNLIVERRTEVQKLKHEMKLYHVINSQVGLLNEWPKLEGKNYEAIFRVTRKLSAVSVKIPFQDAKADAESVDKAFSTAMEVMNGIESAISTFVPKVEKFEFLLTELISTWKYEQEYADKLHNTVAIIPTLVVDESFTRVNIIKTALESRRS